MEGLKPKDQLIIAILIADCQRALGQYVKARELVENVLRKEQQALSEKGNTFVDHAQDCLVALIGKMGATMTRKNFSLRLWAISKLHTAATIERRWCCGSRSTLLREKKYDQAEPLFKKARDLNQSMLGGDNAATASGAHDLGELT